MYVNCQTHNTDGNMEDLDDLMMQMDEKNLVHIVIRHCPQIEIPCRIQTFPHVVGMKIYRSTIARWDTKAALTGNHHENMVLLYLVDVNMTQIPDGLLSENFPLQLRDIEISGTNLTQLPDALDRRWQTNGLLVFELCSFAVFPDVLSLMKISILMLGSKRITEIPAALLTNPDIIYLILSNNPIGTLPAKISSAVSARHVYLDYTELEAVPCWIDNAFLENTELFAAGTVLCEEIIVAAKTGTNAYKTGTLNCDHVSLITSPYYPRYLEKVLDDQFVSM